MFVTEVNSHRDHIIELDQTGTHLKYFSQKQDVVLIKNLLLSVQGRWEKLVQRSIERGRQLDDARKRAKQVWKQAVCHISDSGPKCSTRRVRHEAQTMYKEMYTKSTLKSPCNQACMLSWHQVCK